MVSLQKQSLIQKLTQILTDKRNFAFVKFGNTSHQALETLRRSLKKTDSSLKVVKNTLLEKAINKGGQKDKLLSEFKKKFLPLKESTALLTLGKDWGTGLKTFYEFSKKDGSVEFKFGLLDAKLYEKGDLDKIAILPSRTELISKLIGQLQTPVTKLIFSMRFNASKLIYILKNSKQERGDNK